MNKIELSESLQLSRIIHGHWRLSDWGLSNQELLKLIQQVVELGITTFDNADIYGNYSCEEIFGEALKLNKGLRKEIQVITKCGIKLVSDKFPHRKIHTYDYSFDHIVSSVNNSLENLSTDYIDLLLLHRPSPFLNPEEVAKAFSFLKENGKVLNFGVSNFLPHQFEMLSSYTDEKLVTNQIEISPLYLEHFDNGNIDFLQKERVLPMAWSPVAGGNILSPSTPQEKRIFHALKQVALELDAESIDTIAYSWLLTHPAKILPIVGSGKIQRIVSAVTALEYKLSNEQWFSIYKASTGVDLP